jgi:3-dehydroquinate synthase class II
LFRILFCCIGKRQATGKGDTPAALEMAAELEKFQKKVQSGLEEYTYVNNKAKTDIIEAKRYHDQLMDQMVITAVVCQAELFAQAASQLEEIVATMPEDKVCVVLRCF